MVKASKTPESGTTGGIGKEQAGGILSLLRDRRVLAWSLYDFANTPFAVLILTVAFPPFFKEVVLEGARAGDFLWGLAGSLSMAVVAISAPFAGVYADAAGAKRRLLIGYSLFTVAATLLLTTVRPGAVLWAMAVFILANIGYQGSQVFYNAFLLEVSLPETRGRVSGLGVAVGYVAALLSLAAALPFYRSGETPNSLAGLFALIAGFYLLFALPAFRYLRDPPAREEAPDREGVRDPRWTPAVTTASSRVPRETRPAAREVFQRLGETLTHLRRNRAPFRFLVSYLIYMEAIATMTAFTAIYARDTLSLSMSSILLFFVLSQLTAIPGSYLVGRLADHIGSKAAVGLCIVLWLVVLLFAFFARDVPVILSVALLAGVGTGGLQTVSRSLMAELSPPGREGEFFGFYAVVGRFSAVIGPVAFGAVSSISGSQRAALALLAVLLVVALAVLRGVSVGQRVGRVPQDGPAPGPAG